MLVNRTLRLLTDGIDSGLHPGAQLYVALAGQTVIDTALGAARLADETRNVTPMTTDSLTLWMSAGKPLAAVAALQLVERGLVTLETLVADVIPEFTRGNKSAISLRHLLTHTGGFRGPLNSFSPGTNAEIVDRACGLRQEPGWVPGGKAGYHVASSWFVLGEFIRRIDGRPFEEYVREEILRPIGAHDSSIGLTGEEIAEREDRIALTYLTDDTPPSADFAGNTTLGMTVCRPGANARGPIRDLARLYEALLAAGGPILRPDTAAMMTARVRVGMFDHTFKQILDWGLGLKIDSKRYDAPDPYGYGAHASNDTFGHSGNQTACAFADPTHELVVAWVCNGMPGEDAHQVRQHALNTAVYEDLQLV